jgi:hypothetical protein
MAFEHTVCLKDLQEGDVVSFTRDLNSGVPSQIPVRIRKIDRRIPDCITIEVIDLNDHLTYLPGFQRCYFKLHMSDDQWEAEKVLHSMTREKEDGEWITKVQPGKDWGVF